MREHRLHAGHMQFAICQLVFAYIARCWCDLVYAILKHCMTAFDWKGQHAHQACIMAACAALLLREWSNNLSLQRCCFMGGTWSLKHLWQFYLLHSHRCSSISLPFCSSNQELVPCCNVVTSLPQFALKLVKYKQLLHHEETKKNLSQE